MKVLIREVEHSCDDDCCFGWWTEVNIDGVLVEEIFPTTSDALEWILREKFGVVMEYDYEG